MKSILQISAIILFSMGCTFIPACRNEKSAADTIEPVKQYFENYVKNDVEFPDLPSIEGTAGTILTWKVRNSETGLFVDFSWVLAKNTEELMKVLIVFDAARAWNTESYIFLPVTMPALDIHKEVGLTVPKTIYDEDGMNRIRELVIKGEIPDGGFVDQFEKFME